MYCTLKLAERCFFGLLTLSVLLFPIQSHTSAQANFSSVTPGNVRWALVIHPGPDGTQGASKLATILKDYYGFRPENTLELYDANATLENIYDAMTEIFENIRPDDVLFVHFSMPIHREFEYEALLPWDYQPDSPWRSLELAEPVGWLTQMADVSVLVTYPSCTEASTRSTRSQQLLETIRETKRKNTVDIMAVCDMESIFITQRQGENELVPSAQRRGVLSDGIARILEDVAVSEFDWITSDDLMRALNDMLESYSVSVTHSSTYQQSTFAFVPAPSEINGYKSDYRKTESLGGKERVLHALVSIGTNGGELESSTIEFLREIAIDAGAGLNDSDIDAPVATKLRWLSVDLLGEFGSQSATTALAEIAVNAIDQASLRRRALSSLVSRLGQSDSDMAILLQAMNDSDASVRSEAIGALGYRGYTPAADAIWAAVETDSDLKVRVGALVALADIFEADSSSAEPQLEKMQYGESITAFFVDVAAPNLLRADAIYLVEKIGISPETTEALLLLLRRDQESSVRAAAAFVLPNGVTSGNQKLIVKRLIDATRDESLGVREIAVRSLVKIGDPKGAKPLKNLLKQSSNSPSVRIEAAKGLGQLGATEYAEDLRFAARNDEHPIIRSTSMASLGQLNDTEAVSILFAGLEDEHYFVKAVAQSALQAMTIDSDRIVEEGIANNSGTIRAEAVRLLRDSGNDDDAFLIIDLLSDRDPEVRSSVISSLGKYNSEVVTSTLMSALTESTDPYVREGAGIVLGESKNPLVLPALQIAVGDAYASVRGAVVRALRHYDDPNAVMLVIDASSPNEKSVSVRIAAIESLGQMKEYGVPLVVSNLERMARADESIDVRYAAIKALSSAEAEF